MALQQFTDSAGRTAWLDPRTNRVYTENGKKDTGYTKEQWDQRQINRWGKGDSKGIVESIFDSNKDLIERQKNFMKDYTKDNPFVFDEALAKESATAEYSPYYDELLSDYLKDIELRRETVQDDKKLSSDLQAYDLAAKGRDYQRAVTTAEEGYSGKGMYFSGHKNRAIGELTVENKADVERSGTIYDARQRGYDRSLESLDIQESMKERDLQREKEAAIEQGVLNRKGEAMTQYYTPLTQSYYRQFGTSPSEIMQGYMVPDYFRY